MTITAYSPASTWHATVPVFDDAEPPAASVVSTPLEVLADNVKYLSDRTISVNNYQVEEALEWVSSSSLIAGAATTGFTAIASLATFYKPPLEGDYVNCIASFYEYLTTTGTDNVEFILYLKRGSTVLQVPSSRTYRVKHGVTPLPCQIMGNIYVDSTIAAAAGNLEIWLYGRVINAADTAQVAGPTVSKAEIRRHI